MLNERQLSAISSEGRRRKVAGRTDAALNSETDHLDFAVLRSRHGHLLPMIDVRLHGNNHSFRGLKRLAPNFDFAPAPEQARILTLMEKRSKISMVPPSAQAVIRSLILCGNQASVSGRDFRMSGFRCCS
jgi:hypothetical protein